MGINTPWGKDVTKLYKHKELMNYYTDDDFDDDENEDVEDE